MDNNSKQVLLRLKGANGISVDGIFSFIEEMKTARYNIFYNEERKRRWHSLNLDAVEDVVKNSTANNFKIQLIKNRLKGATSLVQDNSSFF